MRNLAVHALRERILHDGRNLGRGILKVDSFLNHQVDPLLIDDCGRELASRFRRVGATKVLTAEISGIAPAVTTALHLRVPLVYARRSRPVTMPDQVLLTVAPSHTRGQMVELIVSPEYLLAGDRCSSSTTSWPPGRLSSVWPGWPRPRVRQWSVSERSSRNRSKEDARP